MMKLSQLIGEIGRNKSGAPLFFLAILAMVMLPMPPLALDMLFTFNIVLALIITLVSVSARRPLDFSIFPTIILATTLLRLSLNVASTRVVLLHGHEGGDAAGRRVVVQTLADGQWRVRVFDGNNLPLELKAVLELLANPCDQLL